MTFSIVLAAIAFITLTAIAIVMVLRVSQMKHQLEEAGWKCRRLEHQTRSTQQETQEQTTDRERLNEKVEELQATVRHQDDLVRTLEDENDWLRAELERRPRITSKRYKILTLGITQTGKTSLTLKWANPLVDLGAIRGSKIERYERTAGRDGKTLDEARIEEQLLAFQPQAMKFFFGPKTLASCKTVVLFINKSDVLAGTPAQVEEEARRHYRKLIDELEKYKDHMDVRVLVGSATYGHGTHHLFSHFVERILPRNAYDPQLLQRMKADLAATPKTLSLPAAPAPSLPPRVAA